MKGQLFHSAGIHTLNELLEAGIEAERFMAMGQMQANGTIPIYQLDQHRQGGLMGLLPCHNLYD